MDTAGVIDEIGPATDTDLAAGDAVMAMVIPNAVSLRLPLRYTTRELSGLGRTGNRSLGGDGPARDS